MVLLSFSTTTSLNTIINTPSFPCFFVWSGRDPQIDQTYPWLVYQYKLTYFNKAS